MIGSKPWPKALGLCTMVLGLATFGTNPAQAEVGSNWMVNGLNVTNALNATLQIRQIENNTATLVTKIGGAKVGFLCTEAKLTGAVMRTNGSLAGGQALFHGCITLLNDVPSAACLPKAGGKPFDLILTDEITGLIVLHNGKALTRISPTRVDLRLALIEFGEDCSLPEKVGIFGHLYLKDCKDEAEVEREFHLIEQGPLTHMYAISLTAEHAANITGSAFVGLIGPHEGTGTPTVPTEVVKWRALSA